MDQNRGYSRAGRIGKVIRGKWRIDARLGEGATATVYAATHRNGHRVALKVLHPQFLRDAQIRTRFMREAYVGNALGHPGVVRVLDDDVTEDGAAFLVMELLEGESFETRAERSGGRLEVSEVLWLLDTLLDVLAAAHKRNIVHRDIKPDNLFLTRDGNIKVLDFGFARMKEQFDRGAAGEEAATSLTKTGFILGTPDFMSPEQAGGRNHDVDGRSDLWSAAATSFFLISGQRVHSGAVTLHQHLLQTATARARSLASVAPDLPAALVTVIDRALSLERERRWADAGAMRTALRAAVGNAFHPPRLHEVWNDADRTQVGRGSAPGHSDFAETVVVDSSRRPPISSGPVTDPTPPPISESVIFVGAPATPSMNAAMDRVQAALESRRPESRPPPPMRPSAPPPYAPGVPAGGRPVPLLVAPDADALTRTPTHSSRSAITAFRIRDSAFAPYFSRWILFLMIMTISAVVSIVVMNRRKAAGQRQPVSFSTQPVVGVSSSAPAPASAGSAQVAPAAPRPARSAQPAR